MNILVTGGAGFIGSHLSKRLLQNEKNLTIIDNLHSYYDVSIKQKQLEEIEKQGTFQFYQINLLNYEDTYDIFKKNEFDVVVHLAALPGVSNSLLKPLDYIDYDIKATVNVLKAAGETKVKHVIFASSSSVYGNKKNFPLKEYMADGKVVSPYAAAKYGAESFCHAYSGLYGFKMTILRFFTVYGPWGRPDMAITSFISKLRRNEEISVFGEETARDYTFIEDIVDGITASLNYKEGNEIINLGSANPIRMSELLNELSYFFPEMKVKKAPFRKGDVDSTWADISKAQRLLKFNPKVSFKEGIKQTVEWAARNEI
ncbi:MAG: NAD-dependent epimerase/dehydratase family protein [Bacillota bacterium]